MACFTVPFIAKARWLPAGGSRGTLVLKQRHCGKNLMSGLIACTLLAHGKCKVKPVCSNHTLDNGETETEDGFNFTFSFLFFFFKVDICNDMRMSLLMVIMSQLWAIPS